MSAKKLCERWPTRARSKNDGEQIVPQIRSRFRIGPTRRRHAGDAGGRFKQLSRVYVIEAHLIGDDYRQHGEARRARWTARQLRSVSDIIDITQLKGYNRQLFVRPQVMFGQWTAAHEMWE